MKGKTPQIIWHANRQPVLSIDFCPTDPNVFATGGADKEINIWSVCTDEKEMPLARHLCSLGGISNGVNALRFSPLGDLLVSGGDNGELVVWRPTDPAAAQRPMLGQEGSGAPAPLWRMTGTLRGHAGDVHDLCWSPDGSALVSGSVENVAVLWDVEAKRALARLEGHQHYVQGVCWDPLGHHLLTLSSDRTAKVYGVKHGKKHAAAAAAGSLTAAALLKDYSCTATLSKRTIPGPPSVAVPDNNDAGLAGSGAGAAACEGAMGAPAARHALFQDENLGSFFRRPAWSPDGAFVVLPAGQFKADSSSQLTPTTYLFARGDWSSPAAHLPCLGRASVAARFSPVFYRLREAAAAATGSEGGAACPAPASCFAGLGYRMVWAVATINSVLVYDTQSCGDHPLVLLGGLHMAPITDLAWSCDGRTLAVSSMDGYCSLLVFEEGELGEVLPPSELPPAVGACATHAAAKKLADRAASGKQAAHPAPVMAAPLLSPNGQPPEKKARHSPPHQPPSASPAALPVGSQPATGTPHPNHARPSQQQQQHEVVVIDGEEPAQAAKWSGLQSTPQQAKTPGGAPGAVMGTPLTGRGAGAAVGGTPQQLQLQQASPAVALGGSVAAAAGGGQVQVQGQKRRIQPMQVVPGSGPAMGAAAPFQAQQQQGQGQHAAIVGRGGSDGEGKAAPAAMPQPAAASTSGQVPGGSVKAAGARRITPMQVQGAPPPASNNMIVASGPSLPSQAGPAVVQPLAPDQAAASTVAPTQAPQLSAVASAPPEPASLPAAQPAATAAAAPRGEAAGVNGSGSGGGGLAGGLGAAGGIAKPAPKFSLAQLAAQAGKQAAGGGSSVGVLGQKRKAEEQQ